MTEDTMIDEELLKPSREHLARLDHMMRAAEADMVQKIERWGKDDKEYARQQSREYYAKIEPLRREFDYVTQLIADHYGSQPAPPPMIYPRS